MKFRFCAALLLAALSITLLTGCAVSAAAQSPNTAAPAPIEHSRSETPAQANIPTSPVLPAPTAAPAAEPAAVPTAPPLITKEEAIAIALKDAGFEEKDVTRLRTEFDYDDGQPEYEVDFHRGGYEYDYEIHAETGVILSKDKDRED